MSFRKFGLGIILMPIICWFVFCGCKSSKNKPIDGIWVITTEDVPSFKSLVESKFDKDGETYPGPNSRMVMAKARAEAGGELFFVYHRDSARIIYDHTHMHVISVVWQDSIRLRIRPARGMASMYPDEFDYFLYPITGITEKLKRNDSIDK